MSDTFFVKAQKDEPMRGGSDESGEANRASGVKPRFHPKKDPLPSDPVIKEEKDLDELKHPDF